MELVTLKVSLIVCGIVAALGLALATVADMQDRRGLTWAGLLLMAASFIVGGYMYLNGLRDWVF